MTSTTDGFQISEEDLKMRGPGDLEGTQQSGTPLQLKIANLATDGQILQYARDMAKEILKEDPSSVWKKRNIETPTEKQDAQRGLGRHFLIACSKQN